MKYFLFDILLASTEIRQGDPNEKYSRTQGHRTKRGPPVSRPAERLGIVQKTPEELTCKFFRNDWLRLKYWFLFISAGIIFKTSVAFSSVSAKVLSIVTGFVKTMNKSVIHWGYNPDALLLQSLFFKMQNRYEFKIIRFADTQRHDREWRRESENGGVSGLPVRSPIRPISTWTYQQYSC